jgi:DNA recombination protein RmuC
MILQIDFYIILSIVSVAIIGVGFFINSKLNALSKSIEDNSKNLELSQLKSHLDYLTANLHNLHQLVEGKLNHFSAMVEDRMFRMQSDSADKLEKIRQTVDEKLHETLEARLGDTFKIVSERLEQVHRGIGEMQSLATGVGDLKRILSNVKTRGIWGEVQLEAILEQMMSPHQYEKNVSVREGSLEKVEFAVKLPSKEQDGSILLPIDAKFPLDVYQKLVAAQDATDIQMIELFSKELEQAIKRQAKMICDKYINSETTTEFAIMFLPVEGLYAEVLRAPGLVEFVQQSYHVVITGPTTLSAILSSLQMGYRTIAIQKRSSEVWSLLAAVRKEFVKFADLLSKTKLKLDQASRVIGDAETKTRTIQKHLKNIEIDKDISIDDDIILPINLAVDNKKEGE